MTPIAAPQTDPPLQEEAVGRFKRLWRERQRPDLRQFLSQAGELSHAHVAAILLIDQCERWRVGERILAEAYLRDHLSGAADVETAVDLVYQEFLLREELGEAPSCDEYQQRFPHLAERIGQQIALYRALEASTDAPLGERESHPMATGSTLLQQPPQGSASSGLLPPVTGQPPLVPGYEILGELGSGGMGVVYKARHIELNRHVALKMIRAGPHASPDDLVRFRAEAETVARLQHSNIVQIYEVGEASGCDYLALEFVSGGNLAQRLSGAPIPSREAAELTLSLARAVEYAHRQGIVHRDLKPANILLARDGERRSSREESTSASSGAYEPKIADFGLAKRLDADMAHTQTGTVLGTASYMAPEQAEGRTHAIGPATDVYSLGAILYELLTGRPPFRAVTFLETLEQVRSQDPVAPRLLQPKVPRDLEAICLKCLEKEPSRRFLTAQALADDLERFLAGESIHTRSVNLFEKVTRLVNRVPLRSAPASTNWYPYLAPVPFLLQLLLFLLAAGKPFYAAASLGLYVLGAIIALGVDSATQRGSLRPSGLSAADMRHFWTAHIGLMLGVVMLPLVSYLTTPAGTAWDPLTVYPLWSVLAGVSFFYFASVVWGRLYVMGVACFAAAPLLAWQLEWSGLLCGFGHSAILAFTAFYLRRISPEAEPDTSNERR
jgi:serine/threonine-protein kinase